MPGTVDVLIPTSPEEAKRAFGDGKDVTLVGGGTIVVPELVAGRLKPKRAILLARAGLDQVEHNGVWKIGGAAPVSALVGAPEPLASAAANVGDLEIQGQATVGGNLCAGQGHDYPRGDLQAPLIALGATVRSTGAGGERTERVEDFLANRAGRLLLEVEFDARGRKGAHASLDRPHAHGYTALSVAGTASEDGSDRRLAAGGIASHALRLPSVEASGEPNDALKDVQLADDALASAWYRERMLPVLVARVLAVLGSAEYG